MKSHLIAMVAILFSFNTFSFPIAPFDALKTQLKSIERADENQQYDFEGIVKLSNCSGSVIKFAGQPESSNAYVLTNGHCKSGGFPPPGTVKYNNWSWRRMRVFDQKMKQHRVRAKRLVYATMTGTDAAIYMLKQTYKDLAKKNIRPFLLQDYRPALSTEIEIISGYWERGYSCSIDQFVYQLKEDGWIFTDSIRYSQPGCEIIGGTSGSPIIEKGTRIVIGVNNTGNESGKKCTMNNPCEVDKDKNIHYQKGYGYGQQTYQFYSCLNVQFEIDLSLPGCELTKP